MSEDINFENSLLFHWLKNLVGTYTAFSINLIITITAGLLYSFKFLTSPYVLLIFGVISPIIFTLCLYFYIRNGSGTLLNEPFPKPFISRAGNKLMMTFDIILVFGFALLIFLGYLNYFVFRFLQTVFFPGMLLVFLRVLFISHEIERLNNKNDS